MSDQMMENFIIKRAFLTPERPALYFDGETYTFLDVYEKALRIAGQLTGFGLEKGQYAGALLSSDKDTIFIYLAFHLLGVKAVILNNRLTPAELAWQLKDSGSDFLITEEKFAEKTREINLSNITAIFKEDLFDSKYFEPAIAREVSLDDVCTIMYTSGTTGHPKGVLQTYGNHWWSAVGSALNLGLSEKDCWLCAVPLFHISGYSIFMRSIIYGMKMALMASFHEEKAIDMIHQENVTIMSVVSTMLTRMEAVLGEEKKLPVNFRCMLLGGGPASRPMLEKCKEKTIPVYQSYGMTETSSQIVTLSPEYSFSKLGSAGKPLFPSQLKILRTDGGQAEPNEAGEIAVKGPNVTNGYLNREEETAKKMKDGWLMTGDIGYLDKEGFLYVLDRRSDLIISGGENIYPAEIEGVLASHPAILDAGVIGMKDEVWGEVPAAFVVSGSDELTDHDIIEFCAEKLAKYKIPKKIFRIREIPRNASKKILRKNLREYLKEIAE